MQPRTTLSLDLDIVSALERTRLNTAVQTGAVVSIASIARDALRRGLGIEVPPESEAAPTSVRTRGRCRGPRRRAA